MDIDVLNEKQKEAVLKTEGPLLVLAGAGSGKTKVLTTRIAYLIREKKVDPSSILAITFTNKAAKEMKYRIIGMLGPIGYSIMICTFHSFGLSILKEQYALLGYKENFTILDSDDTLTVVKKIMKEMNIDSKMYNPKAIRNAISSAKNELMTALDYEKYVNSDFSEKVLKVFKLYEQKLFHNNSIDFDDLLVLPITIFRKHPDILKVYQERYFYVLIDEYQDTNEAQYLLSKFISAKYKNICVVGDESQAIYSWRGANYRNILNFEKDYDNAEVILLEENYRSTQTILNAANDVIKNNTERKEKNLWTTNEEGLKINYHRAYDEMDEAYYVAREIKKLLEEGISKSEIAVLYRTNAQSRMMEEVLLRENIPYKVVGSVYFYNRKEIKDLISYLKLLYNEYDDTSLLRVINTPKRGIGLKTIADLSLKATHEQKSIYEVIDHGKELQFKNLIESLKKETEHLSITELVEVILEKTGMRKEYESEKSLEGEVRLENLEEFKSITKTFEQEHGIISLREFLDEISLVSDIEEHKANDDVVTLMTIHSAKGLEFENVFLIGMEENLFPHTKYECGKSELEEERRLCYVAITRAKKHLWFLNAKKRLVYGMDASNPPSRFIREIREDCLLKDEIEPIVSKDFSLNIDENISYSLGDKVFHEQYGSGVVIDINSSIVTIAFEYPYGVKKMIKGHKSIRKVS